MTGTASSSGSVCLTSDTNRAARTTSSVVTPNNLHHYPFIQKSILLRIKSIIFLKNFRANRNSRIYWICNNSQHCIRSMFSYSLCEISNDLALVLNKSSLVIPGLRGTPAGISTISAPSSAFSRPSPSVSGTYPETYIELSLD